MMFTAHQMFSSSVVESLGGDIETKQFNLSCMQFTDWMLSVNAALLDNKRVSTRLSELRKQLPGVVDGAVQIAANDGDMTLQSLVSLIYSQITSDTYVLPYECCLIQHDNNGPNEVYRAIYSKSRFSMLSPHSLLVADANGWYLPSRPIKNEPQPAILPNFIEETMTNLENCLRDPLINSTWALAPIVFPNLEEILKPERKASGSFDSVSYITSYAQARTQFSIAERQKRNSTTIEGVVEDTSIVAQLVSYIFDMFTSLFLDYNNHIFIEK